MKCKNDANYYFLNHPVFETKVALLYYLATIKKGAQMSTFSYLLFLLLQIHQYFTAGLADPLNKSEILTMWQFRMFGIYPETVSERSRMIG